MNDTIICPNCKKPIPLTEALSHQIQEKYQKAYRQRFEDEKLKLEANLRTQLERKIKSEMEFQIKDKSEEIGELRKQNKALHDQLLEINRLMRQLKTENEQRQIELEKRLAREQDKIRLEEKKRSGEENRLKFLEYEKKIQDISKVKEDLERKLEQKSQQLQGDVLEIELKNILNREFPYDEIKDVPTGIRGADVLQIVKNNFGRTCGIIVWESKRTKDWSDGWIAKLKEDKRQIKADVAIIISQALPKGIKNFQEKNGILIGGFDMVLTLGLLLRNKLIDIASVKSSLVGKEGKKEILWNYLSGKEFFQHLEAMSDAYSQLQEDLETERRWFTKKWAKQEKNIRSVIDNILEIHGDLQHIVGRELPEIKSFDLLPEGKKEDTDKLF